MEQDETVFFEERMAKIEERIKKTKSYLFLLKKDFFGSSTDKKITDIIEKEIKSFIQDRLAELTGVDSQFNKTNFLTNEEIALLKEKINSGFFDTYNRRNCDNMLIGNKFIDKPMEVACNNIQDVGNITNIQSIEERTDVKFVTAPNGKKIKMSTAKQVRPVGNIQPIPTPKTKAEIEASSITSAHKHAEVSLQLLDEKLRG